MTAAFVRRGWRTLGDDKLLARLDADGSVRVAALLHTFNLHPSTRTWFPEVGDLERLPTYSAWTEKRKVAVSSIWDAATADVGVPNRVVALDAERNPGHEFRRGRLDPGVPARRAHDAPSTDGHPQYSDRCRVHRGGGSRRVPGRRRAWRSRSATVRTSARRCSTSSSCS